MGASTAVPGTLFSVLAYGFVALPPEVQADRRALAQRFRQMYANPRECGSHGDFNDRDLDCYEALAVLGIAQRCDRCGRLYTIDQEANEHGENAQYGDCKED